MFTERRYNFLCILLWINISLVVSQGTFAYLNDLPLSALLRVKKTLGEMFSSDTCLREERCNGTVTQYRSIDAPNQLRRHTFIDNGHHNITAAPLIGHHHHMAHQKVHKSAEGWQDVKQSKVQKIFQLSVTALAFLAFGGYLLCMIVQAIKSKGTTYYHPAMMPMNGAAVSSIKKRRPSFGRRRRNAPAIEDQMATPSPDDLYRGLVLAAEQFVKMNQI